MHLLKLQIGHGCIACTYLVLIVNSLVCFRQCFLSDKRYGVLFRRIRMFSIAISIIPFTRIRACSHNVVSCIHWGYLTFVGWWLLFDARARVGSRVTGGWGIRAWIVAGRWRIWARVSLCWRWVLTCGIRACGVRGSGCHVTLWKK